MNTAAASTARADRQRAALARFRAALAAGQDIARAAERTWAASVVNRAERAWTITPAGLAALDAPEPGRDDINGLIVRMDWLIGAAPGYTPDTGHRQPARYSGVYHRSGWTSDTPPIPGSPDPTPAERQAAETSIMCMAAVHPRPETWWACTRPTGHPRDLHITGHGGVVHAVWSAEEAPHGA